MADETEKQTEKREELKIRLANQDARVETFADIQEALEGRINELQRALDPELDDAQKKSTDFSGLGAFPPKINITHNSLDDAMLSKLLSTQIEKLLAEHGKDSDDLLKALTGAEGMKDKSPSDINKTIDDWLASQIDRLTLQDDTSAALKNRLNDLADNMKGARAVDELKSIDNSLTTLEEATKFQLEFQDIRFKAMKQLLGDRLQGSQGFSKTQAHKLNDEIDSISYQYAEFLNDMENSDSVESKLHIEKLRLMIQENLLNKDIRTHAKKNEISDEINALESKLRALKGEPDTKFTNDDARDTASEEKPLRFASADVSAAGFPDAPSFIPHAKPSHLAGLLPASSQSMMS